jgi:uncharacterized protein YbcI
MAGTRGIRTVGVFIDCSRAHARLHWLRSHPWSDAEMSAMAPDDHLSETSVSAALAPADQAANTQMSRISRAMVAIYKEQFGRGPQRVRTHYAGPDAIVCLLEATLTPVELALTTMDEHQRLRDIRMLFQYTAEDTFRSAIEEITGRRVVAFISGLDTRADVASELFLLAPTGS